MEHERRIFLGWHRPALGALGVWLIEHAGDTDHSADDDQASAAPAEIDLSSTTVVLPSGRAGRRLLELLVDQAEAAEAALLPPRITTLGPWLDGLIRGGNPPASDVERETAWAAALRALPAHRVDRVFADPPADDDVVGWVLLGRRIDAVHAELAAEGLSFADVAADQQAFAGLEHEPDRWAALAEARQHYLAQLGQAGRADPQQRRLDALADNRIAATGRTVLAGLADMPGVARRMIDRLHARNADATGESGERPTIIVFAPADLADRFDAFGCIVPEAWADATIPLDPQQVELVGSPGDQADAVVRALGRSTASSDSAPYAPDQITVGVADDGLASRIEQHLSLMDLPVRRATGRPIGVTGPGLLLRQIADYLEGGRTYADLAALIRHPDLERHVRSAVSNAAPADSTQPDIAEPEAIDRATEDWLTLLDRYYADTLQGRLTDRWLGDRERVAALSMLIGSVERAIESLDAERRPRHAWAQRIADTLAAIYRHRPFEADRRADAALLDTLETLAAALREEHDAAPALAGDTAVTAGQAIRLLLGRIAGQTLAPPPDRAAIELVGWLELALDDADRLIVAGMNEGHVPTSVVGDALLPDGLRRELGLTDNARRYARDAYALSTMLASGRAVTLIAGRMDDAGQPTWPSRLLLADEPMTVAERMRRFMADDPAPPRVHVVREHLPEDAASPFALWPPPPPPDVPVLRKLRVTAFRDYLACPFRFYLAHVCRLESIDDAAIELDGARFGNLAHDVLQQFGVSEAAHASDAAAIARWLDDALDTAFGRRHGDRLAAPLLIQREQLRARLHDFAHAQARWRQDGWRIEHVETNRTLAATLRCGGHDVTCAGQPFTITGRIDRIDVHEKTGERLLLDYKTADSGKSPDQAHRAGPRDGKSWVDLQLPLYRQLARAMDIDRIVDVGYVLLPKSPETAGVSLAGWGETELAEAEAEAARIVGCIERNAYWPPASGVAYDAFAAICGSQLLTSRDDAADGDDEPGGRP